jgi:molecular chaperone GrpE
MSEKETGISSAPAKQESNEQVKKGRARKYLEEINKLKEENEKLQDKLLRKIAEFDNYKKRNERDFYDRIQNANEQLIRQLLPVLDDLERFLVHATQTQQEDPLVAAIDLIYKKFVAILEKTGLTAFSSVGEDFDPEKHDALLQQESDLHSSGKIIEEHVKGYTLNEKVIRHAQVIVAK